MAENKIERLTPHDERAVAVAAGVDPRTVRAYLQGKPQRSTVASRVKSEIEKYRAERAAAVTS